MERGVELHLHPDLRPRLLACASHDFVLLPSLFYVASLASLPSSLLRCACSFLQGISAASSRALTRAARTLPDTRFCIRDNCTDILSLLLLVQHSHMQSLAWRCDLPHGGPELYPISAAEWNIIPAATILHLNLCAWPRNVPMLSVVRPEMLEQIGVSPLFQRSVRVVRMYLGKPNSPFCQACWGLSLGIKTCR